MHFIHDVLHADDAKLTAGNMVLISLGIIILVIVIPFLFVGLVLLWIKSK